MKLRNNIRFASAVTLLGIFGLAGNVGARENVVSSAHKRSMAKTTATGCTPATSEVDLDINNVRAKLMTGGDMWWDRGQGKAAYEVPKGSGKSSQFAASCWIGGFDKQGQLKVAAQTYRQDGNDYWPGALDNDGKITKDDCALWDHQWKVDRSTINTFISLSKTGGNTTGSAFDVINKWPGTGSPNVKGQDDRIISLNANHTYAPFVDLNGNGIYEPSKGEYPAITGDQYIWWVFNDAGNVKQQSLTSAMGVEVQASAFAYATQDFLNNATFCNYRVINRGSLTIDSTYIAVWDDADLGYAFDDYIGCDTSRGLGILYNGTNDDGGSAGHPVNSYGVNPPQVGLDFFQGPKRIVGDTAIQLGMTNFTYYNNDFSIIGNPRNGVHIYNYMTGSITDGERFSDDFTGPGSQSKGYGGGPVSNFVFWGDPGNKTDWSECACNNNAGDRRFVFSSGPFQLLSGALNDITFGCIWAAGVGGCPQTNFKTIKNMDDGAQALFDSHFKTVEGPEAPRMVVRELDRKLVFYLVNDYGSNNFGENYGNTSGAYNDSLQYHQMVVKSKGISNDSLYHFEGYRVFQLADASVSTADIFDPNTGEVNTTKAVEVFQTDVKNGIKGIVNYTKNPSVSDTSSLAQIKISNTKDSGITHSFVLTLDKFATGPDKQFINYHSYYFVAIAYGYNNFAKFDPNNTVATQDVAYIGSSHGAGGTNVVKVTAIPNSSNGDFGNIINSEFGEGVVITRIEGQGNGGNVIQMDEASENKALLYGIADSATYLKSQGPINIKVIDPVKIPTPDVVSDWVFQIKGDNTTANGMNPSSTWALTGFLNGKPVETIYGEQTIGSVNEQIIEKYGFSINVSQKLSPGTDQANGNGYITSDITFGEEDKPWLFGVPDQPDSVFANWLRSGNVNIYNATPDSLKNPCNYNDYSRTDTNSNYQNMLANYTPAKSTWGPYVLAAAFASPNHVTGASGTQCGFEIAYSKTTQTAAFLHQLPDVNLVFTSDKTKWTKCAVVEEQEDPRLSQGGAPKFSLRNHAGWTGKTVGGPNNPEYSTKPEDIGTSWFPGYAINEATGERLNIVFGEDSHLAGADHGNDMIWNPSANFISFFDASIIFGGKHIVYVANTRYDSCKAFMALLKSTAASGKVADQVAAYGTMAWTGVPLVNSLVPLKSLADGIIPTKTTLRFKVNRPYAPFSAVDTTKAGFPPTGISVTPGKQTNPIYTFTTKDLAPTLKSDTTDRDRLLSRIFAVPNPYYGYSGYERNRLDTKVRIINLPAQTTIHIYALDGSLVRTLTKNDINTPYIDWDIRNSAGLPVASGMYMMHVKAEGIGETVIRWFGAARPIDISTY
ncbi:MAG: hypothetical protein JWQ38_1771 [Flavipsychrobacter sp.]|nr:hypothetical protein [Flavipsychrobacter sp.]